MNTFPGWGEDFNWWQLTAAGSTGKIPRLVGFKLDVFETGSFQRKWGNNGRWMQSRPVAGDKTQTKPHYGLILFSVTTRSPTINSTDTSFHFFKKIIEVHLRSGQQLEQRVCAEGSSRETRREVSDSSPAKKWDIEEDFCRLVLTRRQTALVNESCVKAAASNLKSTLVQ